jgi:hypothetical protein
MKKNKHYECKQLAIDDGFLNISEFASYFIKTCKMKPGDIVECDIIYWKDFVKNE